MDENGKAAAAAAAFLVVGYAYRLLVKQKKPRRRRWWVTSVNGSRRRYNGTDLLMDMIKEPSAEFSNFCRLSRDDFQYLLEKVGPVICKKDLIFIPPSDFTNSETSIGVPDVNFPNIDQDFHSCNSSKINSLKLTKNNYDSSTAENLTVKREIERRKTRLVEELTKKSCYKREVSLPVEGRRLVFKFGTKATGWRTNNPNFKF